MALRRDTLKRTKGGRIKAKAIPQTALRRSARLNPRPASIETSHSPTASRSPSRETGSTASPSVSIDHWLETGTWPREYFEPNQDLIAKMATAPRFLARTKASPNSRLRRTETSDQKQREGKSTPYQSSLYELSLKEQGSFMHDSAQGITEDSENHCNHLLNDAQTIPQGTLFDDNIFAATCRALQGKNEARIFRDMTPLLVPSAESLALRGDTDLATLVESINEGWDSSIPLNSTRPQPDYSVGFKNDTFTKEQLEKLSPQIGDSFAGDVSFLKATSDMYFPFLTCEAKSGAVAIEIADRQNAHSMTLAVRAIVTLFRLANRQEEIDRTVLAFSVSHDNRSVRIYGHYPIIEGDKTSFYRHEIDSFSLTGRNGVNKWTAYKFTMNVYKSWLPDHLARIRSAIDDIPPLDLESRSSDSTPPPATSSKKRKRG